MTYHFPLTEELEHAFTFSSDPEATFAAVLPAVCEALQTDRCFLHLRNPKTRVYKNLCWRRSAEIPDTSTNGWEPEENWEDEDPMFAAALRGDASIFVDDVETTAPEVLNREFERKNFGHRALIHAHVVQEGELWAILQPCIFGQPRDWSEDDRTLVYQILERLKPVAIAYVTGAGV